MSYYALIGAHAQNRHTVVCSLCVCVCVKSISTRLVTMRTSNLCMAYNCVPSLAGVE